MSNLHSVQLQYELGLDGTKGFELTAHKALDLIHNLKENILPLRKQDLSEIELDLARLKGVLALLDNLSLEDYDFLYGEIESLQYKAFLLGQTEEEVAAIEATSGDFNLDED